MPSPETVLFDLDDTLCEYRRNADEVLAAAFERADVEPFFDLADWTAVVLEVETVDSQADFRRTTMGTLAERRGRDADHARAVADAFGAERDHADVRFLPGAREVLDALAERHQLGLVTNGAPEMQEPKLAALAIADRFEEIVYAGAETLAKPHPSPFERILNRLDATPDRSVHVGNSLASDIAGAKASGLRAVWVPCGDETATDGAGDPDHTLDSLHDLHTVLGLER